MALPIDNAENNEYKARNFEDLDSLISELSTERQTFEPAPGTEPAGERPPLFPGDNNGGVQLPDEAISHEDAERAGKRMATMIDGALSFSGMLIAKENEADKYKASEGELKDLSDACSEVTEQYSFKINPWFNVGILILFIYMPKLIQASNDRRIKVLEKQQIEMEARIKKIEKEKEVSNAHI